MVTAPEAVALLATAAGFDGREVDRMQTQAWAEALADIDFTDARAVIVDHYRQEHWKVTPAHIIKSVRQIEADRIAAGPNIQELEPPEWITSMEDGPEFNAAFRDWLQDTHWRIRRGLPIECGEPPVLSSRQFSALVS